MEIRHRIELERGIGLVSVVRSGLWESADVVAYRRDLASALAQASAWPAFDVLIDLSAAPVMPQATAAGMDEVGQALLASRARRIAFVSQSAVARLQVQRLVSDGDRVRQFGDASEARAWLGG